MKTNRAANAGISNIWVALLLPVFVGFVGLAIDVGYMVWVAQQLQIGADAGALAGVRHLPARNPDGARDAAQETAEANPAGGKWIELDRNNSNEADYDIVIGRFNREHSTFTATLSNPNAIKVVARRTNDSPNGALDLFFGPALGIDTANLSRSAIAMFGGGTGHGLIVLNPEEDHAFEVGGSSILQVNGGDIQVNSNHPHAALFQGSKTGVNPDLTNAGSVNIVGGYQTRGNPELPRIKEGVEPLHDPIRVYLEELGDDKALVPTDYYCGLTARESEREPEDGTYQWQPGYYEDGISTTTGTHVFQPGIYALDGDGLNVTGGEMIAEGVMFYIMGTGSVFLRGNADVTLTPLDDEGNIYHGISIFQAYDNTNDVTLRGTADTILEGAFYFPDARVDASGDSLTLGNQLITNNLLITGNGSIIINYTGKEPGIGTQTFLVQ
ncbi:MAG: pilus assembly protein TadG-related protein [Candidatus Hydrogenedentota bacterium]